VWAADYKPFGEATITVSTITNNLRFPGQYYDSETGLHYNYFRDYNPAIGRYAQADPIGLEGGVNLYVYADNNPLNRYDPNGNIAIVDDATIIALTGLVMMTVAYLESPAGQQMLSQNIKHIKDVIDGLLEHAQEHVEKCSTSPPEDPNQKHWRKEIKAALDRARKLADKRLSGKLRDQILQVIAKMESLVQ